VWRRCGRPWYRTDADRGADGCPEVRERGIIVTASHNPAPDNGIKLWTKLGRAFNDERNEHVTKTIQNEAFRFAAHDAIGDVERIDDAWATHRRALEAAVSLPNPLWVVVDVGNGVGRLTADVLTRWRFDIENLNAQRDGWFPGRPSEPTEEHCQTACEVVAATDAESGSFTTRTPTGCSLSTNRDDPAGDRPCNGTVTGSGPDSEAGENGTTRPANRCDDDGSKEATPDTPGVHGRRRLILAGSRSSVRPVSRRAPAGRRSFVALERVFAVRGERPRLEAEYSLEPVDERPVVADDDERGPELVAQ